MEGNGGSLDESAEAFVQFLRGAQLVLRSSVFTVLWMDTICRSCSNWVCHSHVKFYCGFEA